MKKKEMQLEIEELRNNLSAYMKKVEELERRLREETKQKNTYIDMYLDQKNNQELINQVVNAIHDVFDVDDWAKDAGSENLPCTK